MYIHTRPSPLLRVPPGWNGPTECRGGGMTEMGSGAVAEANAAIETRGSLLEPPERVLGPYCTLPAEALPPFRPAPAPSGRWRRRWALGLGGWAVFVAAVYAGAGGHLNPYLSLTGLFVGFLVGLTGMGGGALMTPILIFVFGFSPTLAVGTDVTYAAVTKVFGSWRHWKQGSVDLPLALWLCAGSVPMSLLGVGTITYLKHNYGDVLNGILYRRHRHGADGRRRAAHRQGRDARRPAAPP